MMLWLSKIGTADLWISAIENSDDASPTMFDLLDLRALLAITELGLSQSSVSEHLKRLKRRNSRSNSLFLRDAHSNPLGQDGSRSVRKADHGVFAGRAHREACLAPRVGMRETDRPCWVQGGHERGTMASGEDELRTCFD
jgi:hypothetical protein